MEGKLNGDNPTVLSRHISRRQLLQVGAVAAVSSLFPKPVLALANYRFPMEKKLSFYNTHTGERLETVYRSGYRYIPENLQAINRLMRDHRTGDIKIIDTRLLELLYVLSEKLDSRSPFYIVSAYRSAESNRKLRARSSRVAKRSMHMYGKAVDIRLPGCELKELKGAAVQLGGGGVGYYPDSNFVHLDVGPVRYW